MYINIYIYIYIYIYIERERDTCSLNGLYCCVFRVFSLLLLIDVSCVCVVCCSLCVLEDQPGRQQAQRLCALGRYPR